MKPTKNTLIEELEDRLKLATNATEPGNKILNDILSFEIGLLTLGFKITDRDSIAVQFSYGINPLNEDYMICLTWLRGWNNYELKEFPFYCNGHLEIKTVHQLQNLYHALTGEELKQ